MITQETKSMIEKEALELYPITQLWNGAYYEDTNKDTRAGYIAAAFKYAEKVEEIRQQAIFSEEIIKQLETRVNQDGIKLSRLKVIAESLAIKLRKSIEFVPNVAALQGIIEECLFALTAYAEYCKEK